MKISGSSPVKTPSIQRRERSSRASGSFAGELTGDSAVRETAAPADIATVSTLISVQEVDDPVVGRKRAVKRGEDLLDRLDELRHGLLIGAYSSEKLNQLLVMVRRRQDGVADPQLREILNDIELRAAVELAKMGKTD